MAINRFIFLFTGTMILLFGGCGISPEPDNIIKNNVVKFAVGDLYEVNCYRIVCNIIFTLSLKFNNLILYER